MILLGACIDTHTTLNIICDKRDPVDYHFFSSKILKKNVHFLYKNWWYNLTWCCTPIKMLRKYCFLVVAQYALKLQIFTVKSTLHFFCTLFFHYLKLWISLQTFISSQHVNVFCLFFCCYYWCAFLSAETKRVRENCRIVIESVCVRIHMQIVHIKSFLLHLNDNNVHNNKQCNTFEHTLSDNHGTVDVLLCSTAITVDTHLNAGPSSYSSSPSSTTSSLSSFSTSSHCVCRHENKILYTDKINNNKKTILFLYAFNTIQNIPFLNV